MKKKMYWGIASLILILGVVGTYFMLNGHWHNGEWHDESHEPILIGINGLPESETIEELKKYRNFFISFDDDSPKEEWYKFHKKHLQYLYFMRAFDYKTSSSAQIEIARQIQERVKALGSIISNDKAIRYAILKEYLNFFISFDDDSPNEEWYKFNEKHLQYLYFMHGFDYKTYSSAEIEIVGQIQKRIIALGDILKEKISNDKAILDAIQDKPMWIPPHDWKPKKIKIQ